MVTVGKTEEGKPICKLLKPQSYFRTYNEAYAALVAYNQNPFDVRINPTMNELLEEWLSKRAKKHEKDNWIRNAWSYCPHLHDMKVRDVRTRHLKMAVEQSKAPLSVQLCLKSVLNMLLDYAVEYELLDKNYARDFDVTDLSNSALANRKGHISYSEEELNALWANLGNSRLQTIDAILIQCYTGFRPNELLKMKIEDVDLEARTMLGGSKTEAGKNRVVPIHSRIYPLVKKRYEIAEAHSGKYLIGAYNKRSGKWSERLSYDKWMEQQELICTELGLNPEHRLHDGRVCFVTRAKEAKMDEYAIKYIIGHKIEDLTENTYTKRDISWLQEEIEKIK
jgi:integrase